MSDERERGRPAHTRVERARPPIGDMRHDATTDAEERGLSSEIGSDIGDQGDVLAHCQTRYQVVELEHEADVFPPIGGERGVVRARQGMVSEAQFAGTRDVQSAEDVQQGRLAAARCAEEDNVLTALDLEVDPAQGVHRGVSFTIDLGKAVRGEDEGRGVEDHASGMTGTVDQDRM